MFERTVKCAMEIFLRHLETGLEHQCGHLSQMRIHLPVSILDIELSGDAQDLTFSLGTTQMEGKKLDFWGVYIFKIMHSPEDHV